VLTIACDGYIIGIKTKAVRGLAHYELIWEIPDKGRFLFFIKSKVKLLHTKGANGKCITI